MSSFDVAAAERAFRRGRLLRTTEVGTVAVLVALAGLFFATSWLHALPYALVFFTLSVLLSYRGRDSGRLALSAILLGILPLACSLLAQVVGHTCTPAGCVSLCVPLCTAGGLGAGFLLARLSAAQPRPFMAWLGGASLVVATGAMGCSCVGWAGAAGMGLGVIVTGALYSLRRTV